MITVTRGNLEGIGPFTEAWSLSRIIQASIKTTLKQRTQWRVERDLARQPSGQGVAAIFGMIHPGTLATQSRFLTFRLALKNSIAFEWVCQRQ
ncbi:hypothetical protein D3C75_1001680 [compost metagenome]